MKGFSFKFFIFYLASVFIVMFTLGYIFTKSHPEVQDLLNNSGLSDIEKIDLLKSFVTPFIVMHFSSFFLGGLIPSLITGKKMIKEALIASFVFNLPSVLFVFQVQVIFVLIVSFLAISGGSYFGTVLRFKKEE